MQTETLQQKAMQDIFALDDAVSQFESFGSQLDLGLPQAEDDAPKSFEDMLEVNPSDEPMEYGENFMSEGDDLQDKQTQKFVVDEFAKEAAKLPDGGITAADITGISAVIQMNNHITGDVRSFIQQTIDHAVQAQQQQNVSDALPNGTVAQDIAKTGDAGADAGMDPVDGGIPPMEPIDPTAEPSLEPNPEPLPDIGPEPGADPLADMPDADNLGDINDSLDAEGSEAPLGDEDGFAGSDDADGFTDAEGKGEPAAEGDSADSDLDSFLDSEDDLDKDADLDSDKTDDTESLTDEGEDKGSEEDSDEDFNFEAIATKAKGLVEMTEGTEPTEQPAEADAVATAGETEGETAATTDLGNESSEETTEEPSGEPITSSDNRSMEAQVESIVNEAKMKMAADKAKTILESYNDNRERENVLAKLDGVVSNLRKSIVTESIVANYAKESKKQAALESMANAVYDKDNKKQAAKSVFESTMAKIDSVLDTSKKSSVQADADKVIAAFEAKQKSAKTLDSKLNSILESVAVKKPVQTVDQKQAKINAMVESAAAKVSAENKFTAKLNSILEGVQKSQEASKASKELDQKLDAIVNEVKGA